MFIKLNKYFPRWSAQDRKFFTREKNKDTSVTVSNINDPDRDFSLNSPKTLWNQIGKSVSYKKVIQLRSGSMLLAPETLPLYCITQKASTVMS